MPVECVSYVFRECPGDSCGSDNSAAPGSNKDSGDVGGTELRGWHEPSPSVGRGRPAVPAAMVSGPLSPSLRAVDPERERGGEGRGGKGMDAGLGVSPDPVHGPVLVHKPASRRRRGGMRPSGNGLTR